MEETKVENISEKQSDKNIYTGWITQEEMIKKKKKKKVIKPFCEFCLESSAEFALNKHSS